MSRRELKTIAEVIWFILFKFFLNPFLAQSGQYGDKVLSAGSGVAVATSQNLIEAASRVQPHTGRSVNIAQTTRKRKSAARCSRAIVRTSPAR